MPAEGFWGEGEEPGAWAGGAWSLGQRSLEPGPAEPGALAGGAWSLGRRRVGRSVCR